VGKQALKYFGGLIGLYIVVANGSNFGTAFTAGARGVSDVTKLAAGPRLMLGRRRVTAPEQRGRRRCAGVHRRPARRRAVPRRRHRRPGRRPPGHRLPRLAGVARLDAVPAVLCRRPRDRRRPRGGLADLDAGPGTRHGPRLGPGDLRVSGWPPGGSREPRPAVRVRAEQQAGRARRGRGRRRRPGPAAAPQGRRLPGRRPRRAGGRPGRSRPRPSSPPSRPPRPTTRRPTTCTTR
jgi:hypothetical protein